MMCYAGGTKQIKVAPEQKQEQQKQERQRSAQGAPTNADTTLDRPWTAGSGIRPGISLTVPFSIRAQPFTADRQRPKSEAL